MKNLRLFGLSAVLLLSTACKKKDKNSSAENGPAINLNGWTYVSKLDNNNGLWAQCQIYLRKVHHVPGDYTDVFYTVRYKLNNYFGSGDGITHSSHRWLVGSGGQTLRISNQSNMQDEFDGRMLDRPVYSSSLGETIEADHIAPIGVKVLGKGKGEFEVFHPEIASNNSISWGQKPDMMWSGGHDAPGMENAISNSLPEFYRGYLNGQKNYFLTSSYGAIALGFNKSGSERFLIMHNKDSQVLHVYGVTSHLIKPASKNYQVLAHQYLFSAKINSIIPDWDASSILEMPVYYNYNDNFYFVLQNSNKLYVLKLKMNNFQFSVVSEYAQPKTTTTFSRHNNRFQWVADKENTLLYTEKFSSGVKAFALSNGISTLLKLPDWTSAAQPGIMEIRADNGFYWLLIAGNDGKLYLYKKPI